MVRVKIINSALELVGNTPLLMPSNFCKQNGIAGVTLLTKLEYLNPAGSVKDRVGIALIEDAERKGLLAPGATLIEPTSGNTGIGIAMAAAIKGYRAILTLPETMSAERRALLRAYGAELVLTDGSKGLTGAIEKAEELNRKIPGSLILGQFENPANPAAHRASTGPEIWQDTDGEVDIFVAGIGTGGTISGIGQFLKEQKPTVRIVGVEPDNSAVISGKPAGAHGLQGIGAGFIPKTLNCSVLDEVLPITDEEAYEVGRSFAHTEGILTGITSGAALAAARKLASREENKGKCIVVLLPDSGDRYLSTPLYS